MGQTYYKAVRTLELLIFQQHLNKKRTFQIELRAYLMSNHVLIKVLGIYLFIKFFFNQQEEIKQAKTKQKTKITRLI